MRTYQVTQREGEKLSQIDWSFDFWPYFSCCCTNDDGKREIMERQIEMLFAVETQFLRGEHLRVWEGDYGHELLDVGMYDGWPYWRPVPSICIKTALGVYEWQMLPRITDFKNMEKSSGKLSI